MARRHHNFKHAANIRNAALPGIFLSRILHLFKIDPLRKVDLNDGYAYDDYRLKLEKSVVDAHVRLQDAPAVFRLRLSRTARRRNNRWNLRSLCAVSLRGIKRKGRKGGELNST